MVTNANKVYWIEALSSFISRNRTCTSHIASTSGGASCGIPRSDRRQLLTEMELEAKTQLPGLSKVPASNGYVAEDPPPANDSWLS